METKGGLHGGAYVDVVDRNEQSGNRARGILAKTETAPRQELAARLRDGYSRSHGVENWILGTQDQPGFGVNPLFHVKPMELPKFSGKENEYVRWRQCFRRIVDEGQGVTDAYKVARLKEAVEGGRAQDIIDGVLDGPGSYLIAWRELETWFGGDAHYLEQQEHAVMTHPRISNDRDTEALDMTSNAMSRTENLTLFVSHFFT